MKLENQLQIKDNATNQSRMVGNAVEAAQFLKDTGYCVSAIEMRAMDYIFSRVLPLPQVEPTQRERVLLISSDGVHLNTYVVADDEAEGKEPLSDDIRVVADLYRSALTRHNGSIALLKFGSSEHPVNIRLNRRLGYESLPFNVACELWSQQKDYFSGVDVPNVKADLVPYIAKDNEPCTAAGYILKIGKDQFNIQGAEDMVFVLQTLMGHSVSTRLATYLDDVFSHLASWQPHKVSSPVVTNYVDEKGVVFVGGDGTQNGKKLFYSGKFFPSFFTGNSGNVFLLRVGAFEEEFINALVVRE